MLLSRAASLLCSGWRRRPHSYRWELCVVIHFPTSGAHTPTLWQCCAKKNLYSFTGSFLKYSRWRTCLLSVLGTGLQVNSLLLWADTDKCCCSCRRKVRVPQSLPGYLYPQRDPPQPRVWLHRVPFVTQRPDWNLASGSVGSECILDIYRVTDVTLMTHWDFQNFFSTVNNSLAPYWIS